MQNYNAMRDEMQQVHDRVLLVLSALGLSAIFSGGFVNYAPNRLAKGIAYSLFQAPTLQASTALVGLFGLLALSFVSQLKLRSLAAIFAAVLIFFGSTAAAG